MPKESLDMYMDLYARHLSKTLSSDENIYCWTAKQTYIAAANMMSGAAFIGIDSCPIEGFEKEKVEEILKLDTKKFQIAMLLPFDEVVEFIL